jgi:SAM-dependent methyltransferase
MSLAARKQSAGLAAAPTAADQVTLAAILTALYQQQLAIDPANGYLREHSAPACIANQVRTFRWYEPHLPQASVRPARILDWGCQHAPDSCLLRAAFAGRFQLFGCDFVPPFRYRYFHDFARLDYTQLDDLVKLPYEADYFDAVIASGVLEHAAMDYESLKELHRVLKTDGVLVVSYLPNRWSYQEWLRREIRRKDYHRRRYGLYQASQLLKRAGFYPSCCAHHTFFWEKALERVGVGARGQQRGARLLRALLPLHWGCATLAFIARKVTCM